jgi:hypothetical protein
MLLAREEREGERKTDPKEAAPGTEAVARIDADCMAARRVERRLVRPEAQADRSSRGEEGEKGAGGGERRGCF